MPPPNNPEVCRFTMVFKRDTRTFQNVMHVRSTAGWNLAEMEIAAQTFRDWWETQYRLQVPSVISLVQVQARLYDPASPLAFDLPVSPPLAGTGTAASEPGNVTTTLSYRTGLAGRKFRGRIYVVGYNESDVAVDDTISSSLVSRNAIAAGGIIGIWPAGQDLVVWHKDTNSFTPIISYVVENIIDSMRRRLPTRGR